MERPLVIELDRTYAIDTRQFTVEAQLGYFTDVEYFRVRIQPDDRLGLLRVGSSEGGLARELALREALGSHQMMAQLLAIAPEEEIALVSESTEEEMAVFSSQEVEAPEAKLEAQEIEAQDSLEEIEVEAGVAQDDSEEETEETTQDSQEEEIEGESENTQGEYLEEEYYEPREMQTTGMKLLVLSEWPEEGETVATWFETEQSLERSLLLASQVCQFFRILAQKDWCIISVFPQFIRMGTPICFFDLTGAYRRGDRLESGLVADYCAPEVASDCPIDEPMSAYIVGLLLYQAIHCQLPADKLNPEIKPIPCIFQILTIALNPIAEERFFLSQLLELLVETRQSLRSQPLRWETASQSTVGLSPQRLHNEDSYGIRYQPTSTSLTWILAAVADGMGGMAQGEVASRLAIETVLEHPLPTELTKPQICRDWVVSLVEKANEVVSDRVNDGGTTLSLVFAVERHLYLAHVGDSRIFLLRNGQISQLSEDHSLVAMLLAGGEISYEESLNHPDRNVLLKSLGAKRHLSQGYVQDSSQFSKDLAIALEDEDILLLCSDGVWGLVAADELANIAAEFTDLQQFVDQAIARVIAQGADDNATLIALKYLGAISNFIVIPPEN